MPQHRRGSHVGSISLGDTAVPALSTMPPDPVLQKLSKRRLKALAVTTDSFISDSTSGVDSSSTSGDSSTDSPTSTSSSTNSESIHLNQSFHRTNNSTPNNTKLGTFSRTSKKPSSKHKYSPLSPINRLYYSSLEFAYQNTWVSPLLLLLLLILPYQLSSNKSPSNPFHMFARLSYLFPKDPISHQNSIDTVTPFTSYPVFPPQFDMYGKGPRDFAFVFSAMVFFMFFREFAMQVLLRPLAKLCGLKRPSKIDRFMEQSYSILYFSLSTPFGLYVMYNNPEHLWYYNTSAFYLHYPHMAHDTCFKLFYLLQAGFWAQQSLVLLLQLEKPRRDFKELVFHHIVTMALIFLSYRFHFAMIGIAVFITMDVSDIFLALSKALNYLDSSLTMPVFFIFIFVWVYTRHYLNLKILWSILTQFKSIGPYQINMSIGQYKCWISQLITFVLLLALQIVNLYWFALILRIMVRYVLAGEQKDDRSDDEDDE